MRNNIYTIWILAGYLFAGFILKSCSDSSDSAHLPGKIDIHTAIELTPVHGGIKVDWTPDPEDKNFVFLHISFTDHDGEPRKYNISRFNSNLVVPEITDKDGNTIPNTNREASVQISNLINQQYTLHLYGFNEENKSVSLGQLNATPLDYTQCDPDSIYAVNIKAGGNNMVTMEWKEMPLKTSSTLKGIRFSFTNVNNGSIITKEYEPGIRHDEFRMEEEGTYAVTYGTYSITGKEWKKSLQTNIEVEIAPSIEYWTKEDKEEWTITGCTQQIEYEDGRLSNMLDGNPGTYWHSAWSPQDNDLPHHFIVDVKKVMSIKGCLFQQRDAEARQVTRIAIYIKENENDAWGDAVYNGPLATGTGNNCVKQTIELNTRVSGRFIKVETIDGTGNPLHCMAEFGIIGHE